LIGGGVLILGIGLWFGIPWLYRALTTVSTDKDLTDVPANLDETFSTVRQA
jgi:hypothetical protein